MARVLYLDCSSGISGDMFLGVLVDLGLDLQELQKLIDRLGLEVTIAAERVRRAGFAATHIRVHASKATEHRHLPDIEAIIDQAHLGAVGEQAKRVFRALAEAEAAAHGTSPDQVHFHEVGAVDAIVDVVGTVFGLQALAVERLVASRVAVGGGRVTMEHGLVSVPAPGTAHLLAGIPIEGGPVEAELCTPTGAALLKVLAHEFGPLPPMTIERVGAGAGSRDFEKHPNILRGYLGQLEHFHEAQHVWILETNVDDVPGELLGYTVERLMEAGALDVQILPATGKKGRPAQLVRVVASDAEARNLELILLAETGSLGLRRLRCERRTLARQAVIVRTPYGEVRGKVATLPDGKSCFAPEYESCRLAAKRHGVPLRFVYEAALQAWRNKPEA